MGNCLLQGCLHSKQEIAVFAYLNVLSVLCKALETCNTAAGSLSMVEPILVLASAKALHTIEIKQGNWSASSVEHEG